MRRMAKTVLATLVIVGMCSSAWAAGYATDSAGRIYLVLPGKKEAKLVGQVRVTIATTTYAPSLTDLALSPKKGMYGISYNELFKIDMENPGKSTRVGSLGATCNALAFDDEHNLWALGGSSLYRVNLISGRAKLVGSFAGGTSDGDLAFVGKTLYGTLGTRGGSALVTFDTKTGKATRIGLIRPAKGTAHHSVWGLIWDGQRMVALTQSGKVFQLDTKTAIATPLFAAKATFWGACPMLRM